MNYTAREIPDHAVKTTYPGAAFKSKAPGDSQGSPNHTTTTTTNS